MENVILPIYTWFTHGQIVINILKYDTPIFGAPVIFNDYDVIKVENDQDPLNVSFYVLPDERLPYSTMRLPVDLLLRMTGFEAITQKWYPMTMRYDVPWMLSHNPVHDVASILLVTEYLTGRSIIRPGAIPVPGWQHLVPETATHFGEEKIFGFRCIGRLNIEASWPGDVQIIRRVFTEVMGTSGHFGRKDIPAFKALWKYAMRAVKEHPDIRSYVREAGYFQVSCQNVKDLPIGPDENFEKFLDYLPNITLDKNYQYLYTSFKPLHSLDERYPLMEKNELSEEYLTSLEEKIDDLERLAAGWYKVPETEEKGKLKSAFYKKAGHIRSLMIKLRVQEELSIYESVNITRFENIFEEYQAGLDESDKNYYSAWKKLTEHIGTCKDTFLEPTSGVLVAHETEVTHIPLDEGCPEKCKRHCRENEHCRAIGYDETNPKMCRIYSVSTITADISYTEETNSMQIFDRTCGKWKLKRFVH